MGNIRNSRWDDEPRLGKDGKPVVVHPVDSDLKVFQAYNRYRYLPLNFIAAYTGLSVRYLQVRLDVLARKPNKFLNRPEKARNQPNANYRYLDYELTGKGEDILKDKGLFSPEPRFGDETLYAHSRMINEAIVNLEMGARLAGNEMIWWPEIASRLSDPHRFIPVKVQHPFSTGWQSAEFDYYNDSNGPFGFRFRNGTARFVSLEAEHTTQTDAPNLKKTSFLKKWLAMRYINAQELYRTKWGIPGLVHLVLCQSQARIDTRKDLILRETNGIGSSYVAFALAPVIEDPEAHFVPDPDLFNRPWQRAGHTDLYLNQATAKKAAA